MVRRHLAESRTAAKRAIEESRVELDGLVATKPATMVAAEAGIRLIGPTVPFVSRAGNKLQHALDRFSIDVRAKHAIDVGASTGGFTDVLLQSGVRSVCALDVGYGQIHWRLRTDRRVVVVERTNVRHADPQALGAPFDFVTADLSFISLRTVGRQLRALAHDEGDWVLLIKPQFEVGKDQIGAGGVVSDPQLWSQAVSRVIEGFAGDGLHLHGLDLSPVVGTKGNREFVGWFRAAPADATSAGVIADVVGRAANESNGSAKNIIEHEQDV